MAIHTYQRISVANSSPADGTSTPVTEENINVSGSYSPGWTLVRARVFLEIRVVTYIIPATHTPLAVNWWVNTFPVFGLNFDKNNTGMGSNPISPPSATRWQMIGGMVGAVDFEGVDANGNAQLTYKYTIAGGVSNSQSQVKTSASAPQTFYLCWGFKDPGNLLNRSHLSFIQAYDVGALWHTDLWFQSPPA
jgi:hypothetical protein